ncbi:MAG: TIGR03936 family radical SAM-associated protein [Chloroflexota bacterium]
MQRLRIKFSRGEEIKFISHLDMMRLWERALRRAQIPLDYSLGFSPHPRISLAAPLAVGMTSEAELMDIVVAKWVSLHRLTATVSPQLPAGLKIIDVYQLPLEMPSLQSQIRYAEYKVEVVSGKEPVEMESAISNLLAVEHLSWHHQRDTGQRNYDLRALIDDLWVIENHDSACVVGMRLRCSAQGSGRPEQVVLALGVTRHPDSIHRTRLILETRR